MTKSGFDLDEIKPTTITVSDIEAMIAAIRELRATVATLGDSARAGANVLDAKDTEIRELRAENARLRHHWAALDKALTDNIIETDQPHRVRWEGEWHYGPLADAYFAMTSVVRKIARAALGEPQ